MTIQLVLLFAACASCFGAEVKIPSRLYTPIFKSDVDDSVRLKPFWADDAAVTNLQYLVFVQKHDRYRRGKISPIYADRNYLSHWTSATSFPKATADQPVTNVSWFAAKAYCAAYGKRLPSTPEWEVLSDAADPAHQKAILAWYADPKSELTAANKQEPNRYGVRGAHGIVWEWVEDFTETIMSGDARSSAPDTGLFCGGASIGAKDPRQYAAFLRFAFRSSLSAQYTSKNLGFRCVRDMSGVQK